MGRWQGRCEGELPTVLRRVLCRKIGESGLVRVVRVFVRGKLSGGRATETRAT